MQPKYHPAQQRRLRDDFSRAAPRYAHHSTLQQTILARTVPAWLSSLPAGAKLLDAGCATGLLAPWLKDASRTVSLVQIDVAEGMCRLAAQHGATVCADMVELPLRSGTFAGIVCSSTMQWVSSPEAAFDEFRRVLQPHGTVILNVFVTGSLPQLTAALTAAQEASRLLSFPTEETIVGAAQQAGFRIETQRTSMDRIVFPDIISLLKYFKGLGAGNKIPVAPLTRTALQRIEASYPREDAVFPLDFATLSLQLYRV